MKIDKASGIVNDANDWAIETMGNPKYPPGAVPARDHCQPGNAQDRSGLAHPRHSGWRLRQPALPKPPQDACALLDLMREVTAPTSLV